ncbi:hypothetical protein Cs7R123_34130 [Catellatospora sp. TT07R-123]|uniref:inositol monophosphatase family protein n=1 Tax=Catellatospora sp. TT07R-123 TaxID=2733863 RepID=UPI001B1B3439|nr:inositol monophosphatase family protein [Catellatospora sp. TT07R-123]GHJ46071.1 hypothetical protein Cs7R123_34130 [Catellatospora sp. TT07R-123]
MPEVIVHEVPLTDMARGAADLVRTIMAEIRPKLIAAAVSGNRGERHNERHAGNFLSQHDLWMHARYRDLLTPLLGRFVYASEEGDPQVIGDDPDPDLCVLVDPLDTSELAVRGLHGYTHLMIYSRSLARPVVAVVGDIFHHVQLYVAARDAAGNDRALLITADGQPHALRPPQPRELTDALVTNFLMRPMERFLPLAAQTRLVEALGAANDAGQARGRLGVDFGSIGLCHVAAGFTDAMVEFTKGFAVWDLAPGQYVLVAAGGAVVGLDGRELSLDLGFDSLDGIAAAMTPRRKFVATGTVDLARDILKVLDT